MKYYRKWHEMFIRGIGAPIKRTNTETISKEEAVDHLRHYYPNPVEVLSKTTKETPAKTINAKIWREKEAKQ